MCNILKMADRRTKSTKSFETLGPMYCICGVHFVSDSVSSVWGHSVHFAKFLMLGLSKGYYSHNFHPISTKLYGKYGNHAGI